MSVISKTDNETTNLQTYYSRSATLLLRQILYTAFITYNHAPFHLWRKKNIKFQNTMTMLTGSAMALVDHRFFSNKKHIVLIRLFL